MAVREPPPGGLERRFLEDEGAGGAGEGVAATADMETTSCSREVDFQVTGYSLSLVILSEKRTAAFIKVMCFVGIKWAREGIVIQVFVAIVDPRVPRGGLADATVDAEEHLNALVVGERTGTGGSEGEEVVKAGVEGRNVKLVIGWFK